MQPLLSRIRSITTGLSSLLKNTSHISLRHKSLRLPDNDSATKRPNDEHYPLSNIVEANKKAGTSYNRFHEDIETLSLNADTDMNRSINVKKEFSVVSAKKA